MHRVFLADTDRASMQTLACLLKKNHNIQPAIWQNRLSFGSFITAPEDGAVFIRIDDPFIPGLELTRQVSGYNPRIRIVWMAKSVSHALEAFPRGVESYLLLPATAEKLRIIMETLDIA